MSAEMNDIFIDVRPRKRLGQVFLIDDNVAKAEAAHSYDKNVLEIGPGKGMLTRELCRHAKSVTAIEKDRLLCRLLKSEIASKKLNIIEGDILEVDDRALGLDRIDIVIANIPYYLSSSMIDWLSERRLEAVLCLQKEFVEHMLAEPGERSYSKLSVMSSLMYRIVKIMDVSRGCFRPIPKVDSVVIYLQPKEVEITDREHLIIGLLMQHKKKTIRVAILDSRKALGIDQAKLIALADKVKENQRRLFKISPKEILLLAREIETLLK